ncbi:NADP-dependent oxidoreductase domain-containing protein [Radiomyces spectabilis]|uniref:NADP-dependent oxidoreductase domain-containing protein n=1 Tax=Radiomyces spectabilis TaxID=64574 RepID=UPI00221F127A|nr:NADP-dependent oxidoreductase domain-containing protein [Radiomyces spectabilis]KAI8371693.1 NADP-dependent oxidoreductase domain-containing protein [Radiomyces spectabilis]
MTEYQVKLDKGVVPTKDTKIILANTIKVPPIVWDWKPEQEEDAKQAFDKAFELGIPFYDTAEVYGDGESEREIKRFRERYSETDREQQVVATKYFPHKERVDFPRVLMSALKDSLDRLGMRHTDLYQIHAPIHPASIEVVADALADAYEAGLVKTVGVSNYGTEEIERMHTALKKRGVQLASNQICYSLMRRIPETSGLIKLCQERGVAILAYSPLYMGMLTGKYPVDGPFPEGRKRRFESFDKERLSNLLTALKKLADKYKKPQSAIALNWVMAKGAIPIAGARTASHVEQNYTALDFLISEDEVAELDKWSFEGENNKEWQHG